MKNFLLLAVLAVVGAVLAVGSAANEGFTPLGACVGIAYAVVVALFVAVIENQAFAKPWKKTIPSIIAVIGGAIVAAIGFAICQ